MEAGDPVLASAKDPGGGLVTPEAGLGLGVEVDGRRARGERSRAAIVDAVLELLAEGDELPSSATVAERAGVTQRTLFRHFDSVDDLMAEAVGHQSRIVSSYLQPLDATGDLETRIARLVDVRTALFRRIAQIRRQALRLQVRHPVVAKGLWAAQRGQREQVARLFAPELAGLPDHALDAIDLATSWEAWDRLEGGQGLDDDATAEVLRALVRGVLTTASRTQGDPR
jgi:AcrR family transcriptional regulator